MNTKIIIGIMSATVVIIAAVLWIENGKNSELRALENSGDLVSRTGIHWHPELKIVINGEEISIPANIGIGTQYVGHGQYDPMMRMTDMHTHNTSGTLHWEVMDGPVKKEDIRLVQFFGVWGKELTSSCIFDYCSGPQGQLTFKVNGQDNPDFENYLVKDKDKIEIIFQ